MAFKHRLHALTFALAAGLSIAGGVGAAQDDAHSRVNVSWTNPDDFGDSKLYPGSGLGRTTPEEWLGQLAKSVKSRADRTLPPGEELDVTFTDVTRAGIYEPWRGPQWDDVRIIKDAYPPRIDLSFTLRGSDGRIIKEGTRKLRDPGFLQRGTWNETDPLRFEKRMLDDWLRKEFSASSASRS